MRVSRKVKIAGKWVMAPVFVDARGQMDAVMVVWKGEKIAAKGATFYLDSGYGRARKFRPCGKELDGVKRAMRTQAQVLELRARGMEVGDAPEIEEYGRRGQVLLRTIAKEFKAAPPGGYTKKTRSKYRNAYESFAEFAAGEQVFGVDQVTRKTMVRWIEHMKTREVLEASTLVPKVNIVLAELERRGNVIALGKRDKPVIIRHERMTYTLAQLDEMFGGATLEEWEMFQTFLVTGMRKMEVAFLAYPDINPEACTVGVIAKTELGFTPKAYHERTIPVPRWWVEMMQKRAIRMGSDGAGLCFGTVGRGRRRGRKPDTKILEKWKQLARRLKMNCGRCVTTYRKKEVTCDTHPVCRMWNVHKIRHTMASNLVRDKLDLKKLQRILGHKDLATTLIYVHALEAELEQPMMEESTLAKRYGAMTPPEEGAARRVSRSR